jgi:hypothetical protein
MIGGRWFARAAAWVGWLLAASASWGQIPAFPGAEGFGASSVGGRGGDVYHVTSLADTNTLGTLRHAISSAPTAGRTVVFDISGNIQLTSDLNFNKPNMTIAGQTAPGQGITLHGDSAWVKSNDIVVRHLRSRLTSLGGTQDSFSIDGGNRVVMDHISASWSADEVTSMTNNSTDNTIQYSLIVEALNSQNHSRASLFRPGANVAAGVAPHSFNLSVHHSLYAHTSDRNPVFATYNGKLLNADFRNNVVFDWRNQASHTGSSDSFVNLNFVGNYYVAGLTTRADLVANPKIYSADGPGTNMYHADNKVDATRDDGLHNGIYLASSVGGGFVNAAMPFMYPAVTTESADDAYDSVLQYGGSFWWNRDPVDDRVVTDVHEISNSDPLVRAQAGTMLTTEADAGGLPVLPIETRAADWDTDQDGMPDHWEAQHGLDPNTGGDTQYNGDFDTDGYTNIEEYVNDVGAFPAVQFIAFNGATNSRYAQITNWDIKWQPSRFDTAVINSGTVVVDAVGQHAGNLVLGMNAGDSPTLNITDGWIEVEDASVGMSDGATVIGNDPAAAAVLNLSGGKLTTKSLLRGFAGSFNFTGGTLSAETVGFSLVNNGGVISPGSSPGMTHVMGDLTINSGTLAIEIGGTDPADYDRIGVDGLTTLGGTLAVTLVDPTGGESPFVPVLGDQFAFLASDGGTDGMFALLDLPDLVEGLDWALTTGGVSTFLSVVEAAPPGLSGDFNNDGIVDAVDYTMWRNNFGDADETNISFNGDGGDVGTADYDVWKAHYGDTLEPGGGGLASVPEPGAMAIVLLCLPAIVGRLVSKSHASRERSAE